MNAAEAKLADGRIGRRLRRTRLDLGLTQNEVARRTALSLYVVAGAERCTRPIKASELARLCNLYCRDSWYFLRPGRLPKEK